MNGSAPMFAAWQSFYMIVGSSGAALIGLQFVVITLVAQSSIKSSHAQLGAFGTPQLVHFGEALTVSAIMDAPWRAAPAPAAALGVAGFVGLAFVALVLRRSRRQHGYKLVFEDWLWHLIVPFITYAALCISAILLPSHPDNLFVIAAVALALLFIGIRNAWDTVTFIVVERMPETAPAKQSVTPKPPPQSGKRKGSRR